MNGGGRGWEDNSTHNKLCLAVEASEWKGRCTWPHGGGGAGSSPPCPSWSSLQSGWLGVVSEHPVSPKCSFRRSWSHWVLLPPVSIVSLVTWFSHFVASRCPSTFCNPMACVLTQPLAASVVPLQGSGLCETTLQPTYLTTIFSLGGPCWTWTFPKVPEERRRSPIALGAS